MFIGNANLKIKYFCLKMKKSYSHYNRKTAALLFPKFNTFTYSYNFFVSNKIFKKSVDILLFKHENVYLYT